MKKILLLSDTHGYIDEAILKHVAESDEVWHAGDIGTLEISDRISQLKPLRAVYGNIDDNKTRISFPEHLYFECESVKVLMIHIAGTAGKYNPLTRKLIEKYKPDLLVCGHSHILKVIRVMENTMLHINPGAAGIHGFHLMRTMIRIKADQGRLFDLEVIELGKRGRLPEAVG